VWIECEDVLNKLVVRKNNHQLRLPWSQGVMDALLRELLRVFDQKLCHDCLSESEFTDD